MTRGTRCPRRSGRALLPSEQRGSRATWNQPGRLEEAIVDGWFRTGDLACIDEDGYVYLKGRKKEMIIVAGENVYAWRWRTFSTHTMACWMRR